MRLEEANYYGGLNDAYEKSIAIAEKHKADKCKWKRKNNLFVNPHTQRHFAGDYLNYCCTCGKEIESNE